jgi:hypothetical protein
LKEPLGHRRSTVRDPSRLGLTFKAARFSVQFYLFGTESVLNEWSFLKSMLTSTSTDLGKTQYTEVVDNFDTFPASINTPSSDKRFRSDDL